MNLLQQTKSCRTVPKRNAFKAQNNNSAGLTIWVDVARVRGDFNYLSNRILQAAFTQPANDSPSFLACSWINSSKSSSKRMFFLVLLERSYLFFCFLSCTGTPQYVRLCFKGTPHYKGVYLKKQSPEVLRALSGDLTQPLNGVMIMANRYDSAHLCATQFKLYKFYDLSSAQIVQSIAPTERQARKHLGKQSLIFIARVPLYPIVESTRRSHFGGYSYE